MRKVPFVTVFWTFALAIPFTILALGGVAYIDLHFSEIAAAITNFNATTSATGRGWLAELSERSPELMGMVVGLAVMLTIYLFLQQPAKAGNQSKK
jgi:FtsH-binding integral membrane protein